MSLLLKLLALLSQLQSSPLAQKIELCIVTNTSLSGIGTCILSALGAHQNPTPHDAAIIGAAKTLAADLK